MDDLFEKAKQNRDSAIERAHIGQEIDSPGWCEDALGYLIRFCLTNKEPFLADSFRSWAQENGLSKPAEPRVYGSVFVRAARMQIITKTGQYQEIRSPGSHLRPMPLWRAVK